MIACFGADGRLAGFVRKNAKCDIYNKLTPRLFRLFAIVS